MDLWYLNGARYYDPSLKRFITPDTIVQSPYDPQSLNRYAYVRNNPLRLVDPTGNEFEEIINDMYTYLEGYEAGYKYNRDERNISSQPYMYQVGYLQAYSDAVSKYTGVFGTIARFMGGDPERTTDIASGNFGKIGVELWEQLRNDVAKIGDPDYKITQEDMDQMMATVAAFSTPLKLSGTGKIGEVALKAQVGGKSQVFFRTGKGGRYIDQLAKNVGHESKVGYQSLTSNIAKQISKDAELINTKAIDSSVWHFYRSPVTGKIMPSTPLSNALRDAGIGIKIEP